LIPQFHPHVLDSFGLLVTSSTNQREPNDTKNTREDKNVRGQDQGGMRNNQIEAKRRLLDLNTADKHLHCFAAFLLPSCTQHEQFTPVL
jgi:hypothetical protein